MIDSDDIGNGFLFGGIVTGVIFVVFYLVFSVPEIKKCEDAGGVIVKSNGDDICIDKGALIDRNKKPARAVPGEPT